MQCLDFGFKSFFNISPNEVFQVSVCVCVVLDK